jgi:hypothetical protein
LKAVDISWDKSPNPQVVESCRKYSDDEVVHRSNLDHPKNFPLRRWWRAKWLSVTQKSQADVIDPVSGCPRYSRGFSRNGEKDVEMLKSKLFADDEFYNSTLLCIPLVGFQTVGGGSSNEQSDVFGDLTNQRHVIG